MGRGFCTLVLFIIDTVEPLNIESIGTANGGFLIERYKSIEVYIHANGTLEKFHYEVFHYWGSSLSEVSLYVAVFTVSLPIGILLVYFGLIRSPFTLTLFSSGVSSVGASMSSLFRTR